MTEVYTSADEASLYIVKSLLRSEGIPCEVTNKFLTGIAGEIPFDQCWPKLSVLDDALAAKAKEVVNAYMSSNRDASVPSFCPKCDSEELEKAGDEKSILFPRYRCKQCGNVWKWMGA